MSSTTPLRCAVFSARKYDIDALTQASKTLQSPHKLVFLESGLDETTATLAHGFDAACLFVNDRGSAEVLESLRAGGVKVLLLRSAGFNHVDLAAAHRLGIPVLRVPAYSPDGVAEHAIGMMLTLSRKFHRAFNRVREHNFNLEGLLGFNMAGKTVGVVGTGKIGLCMCRILRGFNCHVLAYDVVHNPAAVDLGVRYVPLEQLLRSSDIITLHCPLTPDTHHLLNAERLKLTKRGVMIINTSRGALLNTADAIDFLRSGHIGTLGLDVYEEEDRLFFRDLSDQILPDDVFSLLLTFPNVLITAHQAFFTVEALTNIAETTVSNLMEFAAGRINPDRQVLPDRVRN